MDHTVLFSIKSDHMVRPDCEYLETFWELRLKFMRMSETVSELERGLLAEEMNDFRRRCLDNDKPGRRHIPKHDRSVGKCRRTSGADHVYLL